MRERERGREVRGERRRYGEERDGMRERERGGGGSERGKRDESRREKGKWRGRGK